MTESFMPDLLGVIKFVDRGSHLLKSQADHVKNILDKLDEVYSKYGLHEPFRLNISSNRAFSSGREEVYSDWLQWIIAQIIGIDVHYNDMICDALGIDKSKLAGTNSNGIRREVFVPKGHDNQKGRIDIIIDGSSTIISIEIKITKAEYSDLIKNKGYEESIKERYKDSGKETIFLLITTDSKGGKVGEHQIITWDDICKWLRLCAVSISKEPGGKLLAHLLLGFIGAVEQCVLKYSIDGFINSGTIKYIEEVLRVHEQ